MLAFLGLASAAGVLKPQTGISDAAAYAGRVMLVCAARWMVAMIFDWRLGAAIARTDISVPDNLAARSLRTRVSMLRRVSGIFIGVLTLSVALMSIPVAREIGLFHVIIRL